MTAKRLAFALAVTATGTAVTLSILSGWQRGGTLPERLVWVAIGIVLVVTAHLLPTLTNSANRRLRFVAAGLWVGCMGATVYGHATFFLLAQLHAGERRAASVASPVVKSGRSLTVVMAERAVVTRQVAAADARRCTRDCPGLRARHASLAARLDALNAEASDIRRQEALDDRVTTERDALLDDPVTSRLAALLGATASRVDLLSGLTFAAVLEGVACLLWMLTLGASPSPALASVVGTPLPAVAMSVRTMTTVTEPRVTPNAESTADVTVSRESASHTHDGATPSRAPRDDPLVPVPDSNTADEVTRLLRDIADGRVRPTVSDIRRYLGCSQAKATALRRQLAERNVTA